MQPYNAHYGQVIINIIFNGTSCFKDIGEQAFDIAFCRNVFIVFIEYINESNDNYNMKYGIEIHGIF